VLPPSTVVQGRATFEWLEGEVSFGDGVWRMRRDQPGFPQRFAGTVDGDTISGLWELSRDDTTWDDDLGIAFRRVA
jgi:hypothetical protein